MGPELSKRLSLIADLVPNCDSFTDIGCDHGYVPVWLLANGRCKNAVFADINQGPLNTAKANAGLYGIDSDHASFILSDGLERISCEKDGINVLSITGMGGLLIIDILRRADKKLQCFDTFIFSPHTKEEALRRFLIEESFVTIDERYVTEDDKLYVIIKARKADDGYLPQKADDKELMFGRFIQRELKDAEVRNCFLKRLDLLERLLADNRDLPDDRRHLIEKEALCFREVLGIEA